jgi:hypothetical protein
MHPFSSYASQVLAKTRFYFKFQHTLYWFDWFNWVFQTGCFAPGSTRND